MLVDRIVMNVIQFFAQEINQVYILGLNILPNTVLVSRVAAFDMKKLQQINTPIRAELFQSFMCSERSEIL